VTEIVPPYSNWRDKDGGALDNGTIYIGPVYTDPRQSQSPLLWDDDTPAAQPLRTLNGYIVRAGTPASVFVDGAYSVMVIDVKGEIVYYKPNAS